MHKRDKSLKLAELMGWTVQDSSLGYHYITSKAFNACVLAPYDENEEAIGRCQFAAILLKFPEVMLRFKWRYRPIVLDAESKARAKKIWNIQPTQANILDEILRMNGVDV